MILPVWELQAGTPANQKYQSGRLVRGHCLYGSLSLACRHHVLNQKDNLSISDSGSEIATIETTRPGSLIEVNFMVKEKTPLLQMKMKHNGIPF